jgi:hypothetical protein
MTGAKKGNIVEISPHLGQFSSARIGQKRKERT